MSKYHSSSHTTYNIGFHVVFSPKYRYHLLRGAMEEMPDHVHLFVVANPNMNIGTIVKYLKGYSSYHLRQAFTYLRKYPSLWTRSYFAESIGHISKKTW